MSDTVKKEIGKYKREGEKEMECHLKVMDILTDEKNKAISAFKSKGIWKLWTKKYVNNIIKAAKKYNKRLHDRDIFDESIKPSNDSSYKFNEDEMYELPAIIKADRKEKIDLEKKLNEAKEPEKDAIEKSIKLLENRIKDFDEKLKLHRKDFSEGQVKSIELAELESILMKKIRQKTGCERINNFWIAIVLSLQYLSLLSIYLLNIFTDFGVNSLWSLPATLALFALILIGSFRIVNQNREWSMSLLGKYVTTWEAGLHFKIPLLMKVDSKIYLGTLVKTLYMDERKRGDGNEKISAKVDFANGSAEVITELFIRIFDTYNSTYLIDNVVESVKEKMEAGIRAYYGPISIDQAIETRAEVYLRKIISQGATEADRFKAWGTIIESLAVTDIKLPPDLEKKRNEVLMADKDYEISKINKEKEVVIAKTVKIRGKGRGNEIKSLSKSSGISVPEAVQYDLTERRYAAWAKAGVLIASDSEKTTE